VPSIALLVCGSPARNHDFDFARIRLAQELYALGNVYTDAATNYDHVQEADFLVSYTSQVPVGDAECQALRAFVEQGGRWLALHASNSVRDNPHLPGILGSKFITHPPYLHYPVSITKPDDPLLEGITEPFEVDDELYIIEHADDIDVLLHTTWGGTALGNREFPHAPRPLMYRRTVGQGSVLYLALGHCNRPIDKPRPDMPDSPDRRGPWELPVFKTLVQRGIRWAAGLDA
jgi:type 1 glutamine amidotransferase